MVLDLQYLKQNKGDGRCGLFATLNCLIAMTSERKNKQIVDTVLAKMIQKIKDQLKNTLTVPETDWSGSIQFDDAEGLFSSQLAWWIQKMLFEAGLFDKKKEDARKMFKLFKGHIISNDWDLLAPNLTSKDAVQTFWETWNPREAKIMWEKGMLEIEHEDEIPRYHRSIFSNLMRIGERWSEEEKARSLWQITSVPLSSTKIKELLNQNPLIASCQPVFFYPNLAKTVRKNNVPWDLELRSRNKKIDKIFDPHFIVIESLCKNDSGEDCYKIIDSNPDAPDLVRSIPIDDVLGALALDDEKTLIQFVETE